MNMAIIRSVKETQSQTVRWLLLGAITGLVFIPVAFSTDLWVATRVNDQSIPGDIRAILNRAESFAHLVGVGFILLTIGVAAPHLRRQIKAILWMLACVGVAVFSIKISLIRVRPRGGAAAEFDSVWETFQGISPTISKFDFSQITNSNLQSFPSGHTATAVTLAVGLSLVYPRAKYVFLLLALLAGSQRISSSAHYLSDVVAGTVLALTLCAILLRTPFFGNAFFGTNSSPLKSTPKNPTSPDQQDRVGKSAS
ncbi:MAG: phosphatase PAP2 family protein [Pirellulaceae bacterium]|nr:phosphatase PAP2 family protein [Pirellulaceae bacterium]